MGGVKKGWSIQDIWNQQLQGKEREPKKRDYISASDIGGSFLDRYYKMIGEEPTNKPDYRTLRIFDTGKMIEHMMVRIFKTAGILQNTQGWVEIPATDEHLKVIGYYDCVLGGKPNYEQALQTVKDYIEKFGLDLDEEFIENKTVKFIEALSNQFPEGLSSIIAEIKSVNSMAFWAHKNQDENGYFKGYDHHKLQLLTYILGGIKDNDGNLIDTGRLFYISKDDLCLQETTIYETEELKTKWLDDIKQMTNYIKNNEIPPKEDDVVWNEDKKSFEVNWRIARSPYLTKITGASKEEWEKSSEALAAKLNNEERWRIRAEDHGIVHKGLDKETIKKLVMARDRELKKLKK